MFVVYHFGLTALLLYALSRSRWAFFEPRWAKGSELLSLAMIFGLQVVLPNYSLAYSSLLVYQMVQILSTPFVGLIETYIYKKSIPRMAVYTLISVCAGIGALSYYETAPQDEYEQKRTSFFGVFFAVSGVFASSVYLVWIQIYHDRLQMSSLQLLYNHAPFSSLLLLYVVPFTDTFPVWTKVGMERWAMILMVGRFGFLLIDFSSMCFILTVRRAAYVPVQSIYHNSTSLTVLAPWRLPLLVT